MKTLIHLPFLLSVLVSNAQKRVYAYFDGHRWGLTNERKEILASPQFDTSAQIANTGYVICRKNGKYGALNISGKTIVPFKYEEMTSLDFSARAVVRTGGKYGVVNTISGGWVIPAQYDRIERHSSFGELVLDLTKEGIESHVDSNGKAVQPRASGLTRSVNGTAHVVERMDDDDKQLSVYDQGGGVWKIVLTGRRSDTAVEVKGYTKVQPLWSISKGKTTKGRLKAVKDGKVGILDIDGREVVPLEYDDITFDIFHSALFLTRLGDKTGVIDPETLVVLAKPGVLQRVIKKDYDYDAYLVEMPDGKKGYMDRVNGRIYIPGIKD